MDCRNSRLHVLGSAFRLLLPLLLGCTSTAGGGESPSPQAAASSGDGGAPDAGVGGRATGGVGGESGPPTPESCWAIQTSNLAETAEMEQACYAAGCQRFEGISLFTLDRPICPYEHLWACFLGPPDPGGVYSDGLWLLRATFGSHPVINPKAEPETLDGWEACAEMASPPPECACTY